MAQNEKPLFPREPENNSDAQNDLLKDVKQQLEVAESTSELDLPDTTKKDFVPSVTMYGPPPLMLEQTTLPPVPVPRKPLFVAILVGLLFAVFIAVWLTAKTRSPSPQTPLPEREKQL